MSRKRKGYFVNGHFVAEGSKLDLELKRQGKSDDYVSKTELKRASSALQKLGEQLLKLKPQQLEALTLPDKLQEAIVDSEIHKSFSAKRRHMQYIGKIMRTLDDATIESIKQALDDKQKISAVDAKLLHQSETWRARLLDDDANNTALQEWIQTVPNSNLQQLRTLIRQARKNSSIGMADNNSENRTDSDNSKAHRSLLKFIKSELENM